MENTQRNGLIPLCWLSLEEPSQWSLFKSTCGLQLRHLFLAGTLMWLWAVQIILVNEWNCGRLTYVFVKGKKELPLPAWLTKSLHLLPYPHLGWKSIQNFLFTSQCGQYDLAVWSWISFCTAFAVFFNPRLWKPNRHQNDRFGVRFSKAYEWLWNRRPMKLLGSSIIRAFLKMIISFIGNSVSFS